MHTLLIHQAFVSPHEAGGTRHYEFASRCLAEGHGFTIVASDLSYLTGDRVTRKDGLIVEENVGGVTVLRAYTYPALHKSFVWRVVSFLSFMLTSVVAAMRARDVDIVMGTSPPIFQAVSAWLVSVLKRSPFLLEVRDLWPEFAIDMGVLKSPVLIKLSRWLESFLYARADHIVVNSPAYRDYIAGKGISLSKISLVANGVDIAMIHASADGEAFRKQWHLNGKFVVTYAGALGLANDIPTVLKAAEHLRDMDKIHFVMVGDGKERKKLEKMAGELGLSNVTFTGSYPKSQMPEVLAASDACLAILQDIPMFRTTYPNKVFDYMAAGKPTLLAIDGVIRDVIEASDGGLFVPPGNDQALVDAIRELSRDPARAQEMGQKARDYVVVHFNRDHHARQFIRLIESMKATFHPTVRLLPRPWN